MFVKSIRITSVVALAFAFTAGCASSQIKARKDQRDKVSQTSKMYCEFVNAEIYPDVDVQLNLEMAKRCDNEKAFSITNFKTTNENTGVIYCCALSDSAKTDSKPEKKAPTETKKAEPKSDGKNPASSGDELGD
jgi:hypothetical protein